MAALQPQVYIVTGSSRGIGLAICKKLLSDEGGNIIVGVSRSDSGLEHPRFKQILADFTDEKAPEEVVEFGRKFGFIKGIVLNHGVLEPVSQISSANDSGALSEWKKLYDINFFSNVGLLSEFSKYLDSRNGKVVAVSSGAATGNYIGWGAYGSSKAALNHLIATFAAENRNVFAISIAPGVVDTDMQKNIRELHGGAMSKENHKKFTDLKESGDLLSPEVPAGVIANLLVRGSGADLNGKFFRYNAQELNEY